jgi:hypothetical protein
MIGCIMQIVVVKLARLSHVQFTSFLRLQVVNFEEFDVYIHDNPTSPKHNVLHLSPT